MKKILVLLLAVSMCISVSLIMTACRDESTKTDSASEDHFSSVNLNDDIGTEEKSDPTSEGEKIPELPSSDGLEFSLSDDGKSYIVTDIGVCTDTAIVIPSTYQNLPITEIGQNAFEDFTAMTSIVVPDSVVTIEKHAFYGCTGLKNVFLGNSVAFIKDWAFFNCSLLESINIPSSVKEIGVGAFSLCKCLNYTDYEGGNYLGSSDNPYKVLISVDDKECTTYKINEKTSIICDSAFYNCKNIVTITLPESVTMIGDSAFYYCGKLKNINFPNSLKSIGDDAFYYCEKLSNVSFGNSLEKIGENAFAGCGALENIIFPQSVKEIGAYAFNYCTNLKSVETLNPNTVIGVGFYKCPIERASIPAEIVSSVANEHLVSLNVIGGEIIEDRAFLVGFNWCENLKEVTIAKSVTSIANNAFRGCVGLTSITVDENNVNYKSIDGNLYTKDGKTLVRYAIGKSDTEFCIPTGVTSIDAEAFYNGENLINVEITDTVLSIGDNAFQECRNIESVVIGKAVKVIGKEAFRYCDSLTMIRFNGTINEWRLISKGKYWRNTNNYSYIPATCVICSDSSAELQ